MQGLRKWCVLGAVVVLLAMALLTAPGFTFQTSYAQQSGGEGEDSGNDGPGLTPEEIIEYIEDLLFGDEPADDGGGEGTLPDEGGAEDPDEGEAPGTGEEPGQGEEPAPPAEEPGEGVTPPSEEPAPEQDAPDSGSPHKNKKDDAPEVPDPAGTTHDDPEEPPVEAGSISGCKFLDANRNGCRDADEPGIAGVGIRLESGCDTRKALTAEDGTYSFTALVPGAYEVEVIESTVPKGHFHTTDPDESVCLKPGNMHRKVDFGNGVREEEEPVLGSISGCKFLDVNRNGCRDTGEPGIAGVGIRLEEGCDTWKAVTAEDGTYSFAGLLPGSYEVEVIESTVPEGHFHTTDPDELVCLKPDNMHRVVDFGNGVCDEEIDPGSISGCKFLDANRNGCRDAGEPGIAGVGIRLESGCDTWKAVTAEDGTYSFTGLVPGTYEVEVIESTVPEGHFHTTDPDELVCLKPDSMERTVDFGNGVCEEKPKTASISGRKWRDGDANGDYSFSDCPMAGVEIGLWNGDGLVATCTTSDAPCDKGSYCFKDLEAGTYTVREVSPAGYYPTNPASGEWVVELAEGENRGCVNFLNARSLSISGTKWEWRDENADGIVQDGERYPVEGVSVVLTSACPCFPGPLQAVTGADGGYLFDRLRPGIYTVTEVVPAGWYAVAPADACHIVELICDYDQSDVDFVNARRPSISGSKWEWVDDNGDSEVDEGEYYAVEGVEIRLLQSGVEVRPSAFTAGDGSYSFSGLEPGMYTVSEVMQEGWYAMDPAGGTRQVKVAAGVDAEGVDFLNSQVEVAGEVVTPVAPATATQAGELPHTGMNQVPFILAAGILVFVGLLLLALGFMRRRSA